MFVSIVAELEAIHSAGIPETHGEAMQSEFFHQLERVDPAATTALHGPQNGRRRAYTISPLQIDPGLLSRGSHVYRLPAGSRCWFRCTGLGNDASQLLLALSESCSEWSLQSFPARFRIRCWHTLAGEHEWSGIANAEQLGAAAWQAADAGVRKVRMHFLSPTAFEVSSEQRWGNWVVFPLPKLVFESLRNAAAIFCRDLGLIPKKDLLIDGNVAPGAFALQSQMMFFERRGRQRAGFVGFCEFLFNRDAAPAELAWLHFLCALSFYAGVGAGTAWGMGQVRPEPLRP
jgi:CRISPR-associated endoribonuclease Cas6